MLIQVNAGQNHPKEYTHHHYKDNKWKGNRRIKWISFIDGLNIDATPIHLMDAINQIFGIKIYLVSIVGV